MIFEDRVDAGRQLAQKLNRKFKSITSTNAIVLALPRGGVPVAAQIATALRVPLDVILVRKIGAPFYPEVAVGAVCEDEEPIWNSSLMARAGLSYEDMRTTLMLEREKIRRQSHLFRSGRAFPSVEGKTVFVVDDGLATGATMSAAVKFLKTKNAAKIVVTVPVASVQSMRTLREKLNAKTDEVVALSERDDLRSVGEWYEDFSQTSDEEVLEFLKQDPLSEAIQRAMVSVQTDEDFDSLIDSIKDKRVVMLGESSHGTEEFYHLRSVLSQRLIRDHGFKFIAVEGDWPDAYRLHRYIQYGDGESARKVLRKNHRWPTWMWANEEVVELAEWMKFHKAGFYGLDVYSLFDSIAEVVRYMKVTHPHIAESVSRRYACFDPYEGDEISYTKSLLAYPDGCKSEVIENLQALLKLRVNDWAKDGDELFNSQQNAHVIANAESYYRSMLSGDATSWNVRDGHMMDTLDRLLERYGEGAKAIVWAHNTHIGDYRATDMKTAGYVNIGGLARESYGSDNVALVGFGTYEGDVLAGSAWDAPEEKIALPPAREDSYEHHFHQAAKAAGTNVLFIRLEDSRQSAFSRRLGHRAVGVVYDPRHERRGNYVPTELSRRYDAFVFVDHTHALKSLHSIYVRGEFPETWPSGQ